MIERTVDLPTIGLIAGTRVVLGIGLGLLLGNRLTAERRQACGVTMVVVGALTTIPLAMRVFGRTDADTRLRRHAANGRRVPVREG
jgi:hypothetical protein